MKKTLRNLFVLVAGVLSLSHYAFAQNNTYTGTNAGNGTNGGSYNSLYGINSGNVINGHFNAFFGYNSGALTTSTLAKWNTLIGYEAGAGGAISSQMNTFIGAQAGYYSTSAERNVFVGAFSGVNNTNGLHNVYVGQGAGYAGTTSGLNTYVGSNAGLNSTGSGNVFLGHRVGYNEMGSNKLYIDNSDTSTPLIYGDFTLNRVGINALPGSYTLNVGGNINATGLYVNGVAIDLGNGTVNPWSTNGTAINYNNGNVGIGIVSNVPVYKLDVNGAINATELRVNGNLLPWIKSGTTLHYMDGSVGIGTTTPTTYKLAVNGTIGSKEVKVENTSGAWPDYVFETDYNLPTLQQVERFIQTNKHLPGVPSQQDVKRDGHALGATDVVLLKKVEELTLYLIEQSKQLQEIKALNQQQADRLKELEQTVRELKSGN